MYVHAALLNSDPKQQPFPRPKSLKFGRNRAKLRRNRPNIGEHVTEVGQFRAGCAKFKSKSVQSRPTQGQPKLARLGKDKDQTRDNVRSERPTTNNFGRNRAKIAPISTEPVPSSTDFGQLLPGLEQC